MSMETSIKKMTVDVSDNGLYNDIITAKQGDVGTRFIEVTVMNNGSPYSLDGIYPVLRGKKPDGNTVFNECEVENGKIMVELTQQMLLITGISTYEIALYEGIPNQNDSTANVITTFPLVLHVLGSTFDPSEIVSTSEFEALNEMMHNAPMMAELDDYVSTMNEIVENIGNHTVEADVPADAVFTDTTYDLATSSADGLMSKEHFSKLEGITAGAEPNQNAFSSIAFDDHTVIESDQEEGQINLSGDNVTFTKNASTKTITIGVTDQNVKDALGYTPASLVNGKVPVSELPPLPEPQEQMMISPEMFGAVGDGETDDTEAIASAFATGKPVLLTGTYKITDGVTLAVGTKVYGGAILVADFVGYALVLSGHNEINGVSFTDNQSENITIDGSVIRGDASNNCKIVNCTFTSIHIMHCINIWGSDHLVIEHNKINTYNRCGIKLHNGCRYASVSYNYVYNGTSTVVSTHRYPIGISSYQSDSTRGAARFISCIGNYIEDVNPFWEGIDSHGVCDSEIRDNYIKGTKNGIVMTHPTSADPVPTRNVVIENNTFIGSDAVIDGNRGGIIVAAYNMKNIRIVNNNIHCGDTTPVTNYDSCVTIINGIEGQDPTENIVIEGNTFYGKASGVYAAAIVAKGLLIKQNNFDGMMSDAYPAINIHGITGFTNVNIVDNSFGATNQVNRSIRLATTNTISDSELIHVSGNKFVNAVEKYRDAHLSDAPIANISNNVGGQVGDFVPNQYPGDNDIYGWVVITAANLSSGTKATWKPLAFSNI